MRDLPVHIDQDSFNMNLYSLPLEGFDIILGVQWLRTLGPILWDFDSLCMSFWLKDHQVTWTGKEGPLSKFRAHSMQEFDLMAALLEEYSAVFATPHGLPSTRLSDHHIHLLPGSTPAVV